MDTTRKLPKKAFGFYLRQALKAAGLSMRKLSKMSGIPYSMVIRISKGKANPNWRTVVKMAWAMGVKPDSFWFETWAPPPAAPPSGGSPHDETQPSSPAAR